MRTISFRAKDAQDAGRQLEAALNAEGGDRLVADRAQQFADVLGNLFSLMPEGRQVAVSLSIASGAEPEADGKERIRVKVATLTDRESGTLAQKLGDAEGGDISLEVSSGDDAHARRVAADQQAERDRAARTAQNDADRLRNEPSGAGIQAGDTVSKAG